MEHLVTGCKKMDNCEYLARHNSEFIVMAIAWAREFRLVASYVVHGELDMRISARKR